MEDRPTTWFSPINQSSHLNASNVPRVRSTSSARCRVTASRPVNRPASALCPWARYATFSAKKIDGLGDVAPTGVDEVLLGDGHSVTGVESGIPLLLRIGIQRDSSGVPIVRHYRIRRDVFLIGLLHPGEMGAGIGATLVGAGHHGVMGVVRAGSLVGPACRGGGPRRRALGRDDGGILRPHHLGLSPQCRTGRGRAGGGLRRHLSRCQCRRSGDGARRWPPSWSGPAARYVDGGIIGGPPGPSSSPRLYLSGPSAPSVRDVFADTTVQAQVISDGPGRRVGVEDVLRRLDERNDGAAPRRARARRRRGVEGPLLAEWEHSLPDLAGRSLRAAQQAATKGWRWVGEMEQIAATFGSAGLPDGFHRAAAEIYARARPRRDGRRQTPPPWPTSCAPCATDPGPD